ncbi:hypothetical protein I8752_07225 [Nostocaceae cyanobacterium CENA369]|uniref:Uncharacterized protein n=1 Tax=Dendronalium phyllosphericum CENA369 TaxID=1725256 RepID=A0A8J7I3I0_9NOST|nr:hypothetical protein [Dendronalium phyllosphericum]MBH8572810.1 hypothetical protein [Dendronalium phyllosphericum CENA369]
MSNILFRVKSVGVAICGLLAFYGNSAIAIINPDTTQFNNLNQSKINRIEKDNILGENILKISSVSTAHFNSFVNLDGSCVVSTVNTPNFVNNINFSPTISPQNLNYSNCNKLLKNYGSEQILDKKDGENKQITDDSIVIPSKPILIADCWSVQLQNWVPCGR